ncbi:MAG TPA: TauD/TfdA family dioxygenase [Stellaceae bacterium]|jgi:alpha-ketoglutarate-dependent 2,4-dichlorophenoxyacetate dioxygenase|nr:TauD/TfdA family dioxygenase [Stellaceae bacterium]
MAIQVFPLHPTLGAEVREVDLTRALTPEIFAEIEAAFNLHGILVFPEQRVTDEQQLAFSQLFGPLEVNPNYAGAKMRLRPDIADISNLDAEGRVLARDDRRNLFNLGNQLWHTDSSFKRIPAKCSLLSARELPSSGGETEFADLRAAWDALPEARKRLLDGLVVEHSIFRSRSQIGFADFNDEIFKQLPPVPQALVRHHPASGRTSLYLASHASHIIGWPVEEGRALIEAMIAFSTQPQFVYQHRWTVGDLVVWDNRCTMHCGRSYDDTQRRVLHRTTVSDYANTMEQEGLLAISAA